MKGSVTSSCRIAVVTCLVQAVVLLSASSPAMAAGDASEVSCGANEALIGFAPVLPYCEAYEMVSPPFTDGYLKELFYASVGGNRILEGNKGVYSGAQGDLREDLHQVDRSTSGWTRAAITPSAATFSRQEFLAASPDLGTTLWALREPSQSVYAENLYLRNEAGALSEVGSMVPPSAAIGPPAGEFGRWFYEDEIRYTDASQSLDRIFFDTEVGGGPLWPGDTTSVSGNFTGRSLYEYSGTGAAHPSLVGVNNEGQLLSDCSISLGSNAYNDLYNAVSADGEVVYFTAEANTYNCGVAPEVNELYARLSGADTVAISEPLGADCSACQTQVKASAEFAGASENGSKVFFTTSQELLPGARGNNLYEYDFDAAPGAKVTLVSSGLEEAQVAGVARVSEDGSHAYFVASGVLTTEPNGQDAKATSGANNLYVYERDGNVPQGRIKFVATLAAGDSSDWQVLDTRPVEATPDGQFLVFESAADLTLGDSAPEGDPQVFEYDAEDGELVRVSVNDVTYPGGAASADEWPANMSYQSYAEHVSPSAVDTEMSVSEDGTTVAFTSGATLTTAAAEAASQPTTYAGGVNVYEYRSSGNLRNGRVWWLARNAANEVSVTPDGLNVFFLSTDRLVPGDVDSQLDWYDARVGGGFPGTSAGPSCEGEACQGAYSPPSPGASPVSTTTGPSGNVSTSTTVPSPTSVLKPKPKPKAKSRTVRSSAKCKKIRSRTSRLACEKRASAKKANSDRRTGR